MNTILVPTNFTPASRNASEYAARLCQAWNARLILLNVIAVPAPISDIPYTFENTSEIHAEFEKLAAVEADRLFSMFDIEVQHNTEIGLPDIDIPGFAEENGADLIVMGSRHTDVLDRILGTTINAVIRKTTVPALIIPEGQAFAGIKVVAYATDLSYHINGSHFSPIKKLVDTFAASLQIIHVQKPDDIISQEDIAGKIKLDSAADDLNYQYKTIEDADIDQGIQHFLEKNPVDILAMTAHKHSFIERLFGKTHTKSMIYKTNLPLLILHDPK